MPLNPFYANIFIDSCAFDPKYEPETSASNSIFELHKNGKINLVVAHSTLKESEHPNTPAHVKAEAATMIYTINQDLTPLEQQKQKEILIILTGNGNSEKMQQDSEHVFEAHKHGGYFITTDNRILKLRSNLYKICNAHIRKPSELLALIQQYDNP